MALNTVVTVVGADRTGIIAGVCTTLAANNANIYDIRQTVIDDIFSMTMKVALDEETADFNTVQDALKKTAEELGVQIQIQREEVFKFMYNL